MRLKSLFLGDGRRIFVGGPPKEQGRSERMFHGASDIMVRPGPIGYDEIGRPIWPISGGAVMAPQRSAQGAGGQVPFLVASNIHSAPNVGSPITFTPGAAQQEFVININPGGFLKGMLMQVTWSGGNIGGSTIGNPDWPFSLFSSISLENIDGSPILYPMNGYAYYIWQKYSRPWRGDPATWNDFNPTYAAGGFSYFIGPELFDTAGVLDNTDARSQYRLRFTFDLASKTADLVNAGGFGTVVIPAVTITLSPYDWAQVDAQDLQGHSQQQVPDGLALHTLARHENFTMSGTGANNQYKHVNVGNEMRWWAIITRAQAATPANAQTSIAQRADGFGDPIRYTLDNRTLFVKHPAEVFHDAAQFYTPEYFPGQAPQNFPAAGQFPQARDAGVYLFPRFRRNSRDSMFWLQTTNATFLQIETTTLAATNLGSAEVISDEVVPVGDIAPEFEGI